MDSRSRTKRRRNVNRRRYRLLDDDSDSRRAAFIGQNTNDATSDADAGREYQRSDQAAPILCDKCWKARKRRLAVMHCVECNKNVCGSCGKCDKQRHPWWLPFCIAQCLRFMCTDIFKPHSLVDLTVPLQRSWGRNSDTDVPTWALSSEASHVQRIPRVTRSSLRSNKSEKSTHCSDNGTRGTKGKNVDGKSSPIDKRSENTPRERRSRTRSRSLDHTGEQLTQRAGRGRGGRRARSAERLPNKYSVINTMGRKQLYRDNWESEPYSLHRSRGAEAGGNNVTHEGKYGSTNRKNNGNDNNKDTEKSFKTEKNVFSGNWFDEFDPWHNGTRSRNQNGSRTKGTTDTRTKPTVYRNISIHMEEPGITPVTEDIGTKPSRRTDDAGPASNTNPAYIVEEPPDLCSICLEDLTATEARSLRCNHDFHTSCVVELLSSMEFDFGIKCPVCNQVSRIKNYYAPRSHWIRELPIVTEV